MVGLEIAAKWGGLPKAGRQPAGGNKKGPSGDGLLDYDAARGSLDYRGLAPEP
jgi:hypothetical protein